MPFDAADIRANFPKETFREGQERAIQFACDAFNSGKRIVVIECPTGGGKSTIGMTLANMARSSYYLTVTKILQDQLMDDFGDKVVELKGRNSYECDFYSRFGEKMVNGKILTANTLKEKLSQFVDCNSGFCKSSAGRKDGHKCAQCFLSESPAVGVPKGELKNLPKGKSYSACNYYDQVFKAINGKNVCMNFYSFLYQTMMTKRFDPQRELMIIDEAHATELVLLDVVSFMLSADMLKEYGLILPEYDNVADYLEWFEKENIAAVIGLALENAKRNENSRDEEEISRLIKKLKQFTESVEHIEWVVQVEHSQYRDKKNMTVVFKPVFISSFIENLLFRFSEKILMMSATILDIDVFSRSLGLNPDEIAVYKMKNRFPLENRPIYIKDCGNLTGGKSKMNEWMPTVTKTVNEICDRYPHQKGIIHTHNFAILDALVERCAPNVKKRFLTQRDIPDKKELLDRHARSDNSIILAPAMHEGVDLKDDLSRFQIIAKIPFPNFFDNKQLSRKNDIDKDYIGWLTALKLVQSCGRSVRGPEDYADTYIIDGSIHNFLKRSKKMFPNWFMSSIHAHDKRS
jgi:Rad3-related DNA helicase